jgi:hypothetical protein
LASGPRGVDVGVQSGPPGARALADTGDSARAEEAQVARERAFYQRGEAQKAALLEQTEKERKTAQQARLASIREQQASLAAQPMVRWLLTVPAETRVKSTEARLAATEGLALKEGPKQLQRESAELKGLKESAELKGLKESAELKRSKEEAASAEAVMGKPARPPDRLNEQFTVTSAVLVQEPGEPAELEEPEVPGRPGGPGEPRESAELKELQGMRRAREGGTAAKADTVRVRREAERLAEDTKMDPSNCLMEILTLKEKREGIRIRRSPGDYVARLPWVLEHVFPRTLCRSVNDKQGGCASSKVRESDGQCASSGVRQSGDPGGSLSRKRNTNRLVGNR